MSSPGVVLNHPEVWCGIWGVNDTGWEGRYASPLWRRKPAICDSVVISSRRGQKGSYVKSQKQWFRRCGMHTWMNSSRSFIVDFDIDVKSAPPTCWHPIDLCSTLFIFDFVSTFSIILLCICSMPPMISLHGSCFPCLVPRPFPSKRRVWQVATNLKNESLVVYGLRCGWRDSKMWENILQLSCLQPGGACLGYGLGLRSRGKATAHDATLAYCILYVQSVRVHRSYVP